MSASSSRRVFVTGAARGLGQAVANRFRARGWEVIAPGRDELDLASPESVQRYVEARPLDVDALVNNAGENHPAPLAEITLGAWERTLAVNLTGPMLLLRAAAGGMRARGGGRIVNVGSIYAVLGRMGRAPYAASKAALAALTRVAALEYAADGILVNTLCPGFVDTALTRQNNSPAQIAALCAQVPLGRLAQPDEIARFACFLASAENTYITGQTLLIDGGFSIQ